MVMAPEKIVTLITGANQGIGFELAKILIRTSPNYHILLGSRDAAKGQAALATLLALPGVQGSGAVLEVDVTDDVAVDAAAQHVREIYGRLDTLVNNAGVLSMDPAPSRAAMRRVLETNVVGALSVTEAFLPLLRASTHKEGARLVFVSSSTGSISQAGDPASRYYSANGLEYRASKAALNMMIVLYHNRLAKEGVRVLGADPGLVATGFTGNPESLKARGGVAPEVGGERIAMVVRGERDEFVGRVNGEYGVSPW